MIGISMAELKDKLINGHEAEFTYDECEYSIEMWDDEEIQYIGIWKCTENPICIAKMAVKNINDFEELFNLQCFDGKSFYEIETDVTVETIF